MGNQHSRESRRRPNNAVASMGNQQHHRLIPNNSVASMDTQEPPRRFLNNAVVPLGNQQSRRLIPNNSVAPTDIQEPPRRIPDIRFRVLIIGRANAGKTSILQRVCSTTGSPVIYRGHEEVRGPTFDREADLTAD